MNLRLFIILLCIGIFNLNEATAQEVQYKSSKEEFLTQLTEIWESGEFTIESEEHTFKKKVKKYLVISVRSERELSEETFSDLVSSTTGTIFDEIANLGDYKLARVDFENTKSGEKKSQGLFEIIDRNPILKGCKKSLSNRELKKCFNQMVNKHLAENLDLSKFEDKGLESKKHSFTATFAVGKKGKIIDVEVRHENEPLRNAIKEILESIKVRKPGYNNGEPVRVSYTIPIVFEFK